MSRRLIQLLAHVTVVAAAAPLAAQDVTAETALKVHWDKTSVEPRCAQKKAAPDEITVCGRRDGDRYRLPLVVKAVGDPKTADVLGEKERLFNKRDNCQNMSLFLTGCGSVGVSVGLGFGAGGTEWRPLAK